MSNRGSFTKKMLAATYNVSIGVMRNWLDVMGMASPANGGYYYTPAEVMIIFERLGNPYDDE